VLPGLGIRAKFFRAVRAVAERLWKSAGHKVSG